MVSCTFPRSPGVGGVGLGLQGLHGRMAGKEFWTTGQGPREPFPEGQYHPSDDEGEPRARRVLSPYACHLVCSSRPADR